MKLEDRARLIARQGTSFVTAEGIRVVYPSEPSAAELKDVPCDGKTIGEIVTRGNIVMKEAGSISHSLTLRAYMVC